VADAGPNDGEIDDTRGLSEGREGFRDMFGSGADIGPEGPERPRILMSSG